MITRKYIAGYLGSFILSSPSLSMRSAMSSVSFEVASVYVGAGASGFESLALVSFFNFFHSFHNICAISSSSSESEASSALVLLSSSEEVSSSNLFTFQMWLAASIMSVKGNGSDRESLGLFWNILFSSCQHADLSMPFQKYRRCCSFVILLFSYSHPPIRMNLR